MVTLCILGYAAICILALYQFNVACSCYKFEWRMTHGKRRIYVRSKATGRVVMQTLNLWDVLALGV